MDIYESGEMYLETILKLKETKAEVHSIDVANNLSYAKSSVSRGINILKDRGFITVGSDGEIEFTADGLKKAKEIYEKHVVLTRFLESIGISPETAETDACRIEHIISQETFDAIKKKI